MSEATIIVIGTFRDSYQDVFQEYSRRVRAFLASKGAVVIRRQLIEQTLFGDLGSDLFMVIDFPNKDIAAKAFHEQEYLDILPLRDRVFEKFDMFLAMPGEA